MIDKEQLKADRYVIDYWFNVYPDNLRSYIYISRQSCNDAGILRKPLYRIHVKLK